MAAMLPTMKTTIATCVTTCRISGIMVGFAPLGVTP